MAGLDGDSSSKGNGLKSYAIQPHTTSFTMPPAPANPLDYPIQFLSPSDNNDHSRKMPGDINEISIFSSLSWLLPLFELAEFISPKDAREHIASTDKADAAFAAANPQDSSVQIKKDFPDVASALQLLPLFSKFFEEEKKMIPQHSDYYYLITKFTFPSPKGERCITRSRVEGDSKASFAKPVHAVHGNQGNGGAALASSTVTNSTSVFSLLPGHDHFLVSYEKDKLNLGPQQSSGSGNNSQSVTVQNKKSAFSLFTYLELDQLRFAFAAMKELLEESKTFNSNDGSLSLLAKRDIKKNNFSSAFCLNPKANASGAGVGFDDVDGGSGSSPGNPASSNLNSAGKPKKATNVITAPKKELLEERREIAQKRFLRADLEEECLRRWPHTPIHKSLLFLFEEKAEADLSAEEIRAAGLDEKRINANKSKNRRGQKFYLGVVELPFFNKKGGAARFKATRLWSAKKDAESAAAEVALTALRAMK